MILRENTRIHLGSATATCRLPSKTMSRHPSPPHPPPSRLFHPLGITAGAEDVKYQAKYTDLKRKVREIEGVRLALFFFFGFLLTHSLSTRVMTNSSIAFYWQSAISSVSNSNARALSVFSCWLTHTSLPFPAFYTSVFPLRPPPQTP